MSTALDLSNMPYKVFLVREPCKNVYYVRRIADFITIVLFENFIMSTSLDLRES